MKYAHSIKISVFSKQEDDEEKIKRALLSLIPFDMEKEKIALGNQIAKGFNEKKISIFDITLLKQRHTNRFFEFLLSKISDEGKSLLLSQKESRLDNNLDFFIRLEKEKLFLGEYKITDSGNCFHIKISIAAFPATKEQAIKVIETLLTAKF